MDIKRLAITLIKFLVSFAILAWLFNKARQDGEFEKMWTSQKNWGWLTVGVLGCFGAHVLSYIRWQFLVRALGLPFTFFDAIRIGFIGSFFNLFAFGVVGGDSLRAFYVVRQTKNRAPEAIASVVMDRVIGLLTMFSFAAGTYLFFDFSQLTGADPEKLSQIKLVCQFAFIATAIGICGFVTMMFSPAITNSKWFGRLMELPKVGPLIRKLTDMVNIYRSRPGTIVVSFMLSIGVNLCFVIGIFAIAAGITQTYPSVAEHFMVAPLSMVANAVPLPGGVGGMEFALPLLYRGVAEVAVPESHGVVVAFAFRFVLLSIAAIGAFAWFLNRNQLKTMMDEKEDENTVNATADAEDMNPYSSASSEIANPAKSDPQT